MTPFKNFTPDDDYITYIDDKGRVWKQHLEAGYVQFFSEFKHVFKWVGAIKNNSRSIKKRHQTFIGNS